jgi:hypothetical protein
MGQIDPKGDVNLDAFFPAQLAVKTEDSTESGEAEELDTSEDTDQEVDEESEEIEETEEDSDDDDEEDESEDDESKDTEKKTDYKSLYEDAEEKRRKTQSRADRAEQQVNLLSGEIEGLREDFENFQQTNEDSETEDLLNDIADDGFIDGRTAKKIVSSVTKKAQPKKQVVKKPQDQAQFNTWVAGLEDWEDVDLYFKNNQDKAASVMNTVPTDNAFARFQQLRLSQRDEQIMSLTDELKKTKKLLKKAKKQRKKPPVPATGPGGRNVNRSVQDGNPPGFTAEKFFRS